MADTTSFTAAPVATSNVNSTADLATAATMAPRLYDWYPMWDGDFNSFENWLLAVDLPLSDPEMAPRLGSAAHICGELFACIPSLRQSECAEYIRVRQRPRFLPEGITPAIRPPFVVEAFIQALVTAFMPKDLAARAVKMVHAIQQGDYNKWCTRAGHLAPTGAARIEIHKGGLIDSIRAAAATRGFKSDVEWDEYSGGSPDEIVQPTLVDLDAGCSGGRKVAGSGTPLVFPSAPSTSRK
ncbi:hypothetical protein E4U35_000160 [Claviceps purpurea]|nr:hypothetical protein E4U35_000160 [Claviceps purpurea]